MEEESNPIIRDDNKLINKLKDEDKKVGKKKKSKILFFNERPGDFGELFSVIFGQLKLKMAVFLFIVYILINTDLFVDRVLSKFTDAVEGNVPSAKGIFLQSLLLVLMYLALDVIVENNMI